MPLRNFGSILTFAAELEGLDHAFFTAAAENSKYSRNKQMFEEFAKNADKNLKLILRTRHENVTEMILENVENFTRAPFISARDDVDHLSADEVREKARELEEKSVRFYTEAAEGLQGLPEVSRTLKLIGKRHKTQQEKLAG